MNESISDLLEKNPDKVRTVLNLLMESCYFYRSDSEDDFLFLRRHHQEFRRFYQDYFGWVLIVDGKCARVFKEKWHNEKIKPSHRPLFNFTKRDECVAFMMLLEFCEHQLEENAMTVDDPRNPRFRFGDLLNYCHRRFHQLLDEEDRVKYTEEHIRGAVLRPIIPELVKHRFLQEAPKPPGMGLELDELIFEVLPAMFHYNSARLSRSLLDSKGGGEEASETSSHVEDEDGIVDADIESLGDSQ